MSGSYWEIDYEIELLSDFHTGDGTMLAGGNVHALRRDVDGFPFIFRDEVRGLLRAAAIDTLKKSEVIKDREVLFNKCFGNKEEDSNKQGKKSLWNISSARYLHEIRSRFQNLPAWPDLEERGFVVSQSHIKMGSDNVVERLFTIQKAGGREAAHRRLEGVIYSRKTATLRDAAFMVAALRAGDRVGLRKDRGYGKVRFSVKSVRSYFKPDSAQTDNRGLDDWIDVLLTKQEDSK